MQTNHKHLAWLLIIPLLELISATALCAGATVNPYQAIAARNVFALRPPPPPPEPEAVKPAPPPITLTGIITLGGKRALLTTPPAPGKPGAEARAQSLVLGEGQREGDIEVLEINEHAGTVTLNSGDTVTTLNFAEHGVQHAANPQGALAATLPLALNAFPPPSTGLKPLAARTATAPTGAWALVAQRKRELAWANGALGVPSPSAYEQSLLTPAAANTGASAASTRTRNSTGNIRPGVWPGSVGQASPQ